jgi:hypothetical protein
MFDRDEVERNSEIWEFDVPRLGSEDVSRLEITVDDLGNAKKRERERESEVRKPSSRDDASNRLG